MTLYQPKGRTVWVAELSRGGKKYTKTFPGDKYDEARAYEKYLFTTLPPSKRQGRVCSRLSALPPIHQLKINGCLLVRGDDRCEKRTDCPHYEDCVDQVSRKTTWPGWRVK